MAEDNGQSDVDAVDDGRPDWLPENFTSAEALVQSYKELQGTYTRETQARAALEENYADIAARLDEISAARTEPAQQYTDPSTQAQILADQFGVEPEALNAMAYIAQQTTKALLEQQQQSNQQQSEVQLRALRGNAIELAKNKLEALYPDWSETQDKIAEIVDANPNLISDDDLLSPDALVSRFSSVYKQVKYDELVSGVASDGGTQQPDINALAARMKLQAQTATGASGRPDPISDEKAAWDAIKHAKPKNYYEQ